MYFKQGSTLSPYNSLLCQFTPLPNGQWSPRYYYYAKHSSNFTGYKNAHFFVFSLLYFKIYISPLQAPLWRWAERRETEREEEETWQHAPTWQQRTNLATQGQPGDVTNLQLHVVPKLLCGVFYNIVWFLHFTSLVCLYYCVCVLYYCVILALDIACCTLVCFCVWILFAVALLSLFIIYLLLTVHVLLTHIQ